MKADFGDRRRFLLKLAYITGVTTLGGIVWSATIDNLKANPLVLRPPGAIEESDFINRCIKCGMCVEACPFDTLKLADGGSHIAIGTPYFIPRQIPCYMCKDIPCVPVCPTEALDIKSLKSDNRLDITKSRMGLAVIDQNNCVAYWGIQCDACYRACPIFGKAITTEFKRNDRTGKHAFLVPVVHLDSCTGCGLCEKACITKKPAIYILPHKIALGEVDTNYIKGWEEKDEKRLENATMEKQHTEISKDKPVDYLNSGELK
jgi:ferredoxin-type protein NapG